MKLRGIDQRSDGIQIILPNQCQAPFNSVRNVRISVGSKKPTGPMHLGVNLIASRLRFQLFFFFHPVRQQVTRIDRVLMFSADSTSSVWMAGILFHQNTTTGVAKLHNLAPQSNLNIQ